MSKTNSPKRIAVIGGGPIGLEAALYGLSLGMAVEVYEQGSPASHVDRWGFVRMFTPFGMNVTPLGRKSILREMPTRTLPNDEELTTGKIWRESYLLPLAECGTLKKHVHPQTRVLAIGRGGRRKGDYDSTKALPQFRLLLRDQHGNERLETADAILDCTGSFARPNRLGDGGIPAVGESAAARYVPYWPEDVLIAKKDHYAGRGVIVVGGGHTAATIVCDLATLAEEHQSTWVIWLADAARTQPLPRISNDPLKARDRLVARANSLALRRDGNLEYHPGTRIDEVICHGEGNGFRVVARVGNKPMSWDVERMIAAVGHRPDLSISSELRVGDPDGRIETNEPGYFVLGMRANREGFLLRDGHDQIRRAYAVIAAQPGLNLYQCAAA